MSSQQPRKIFQLSKINMLNHGGRAQTGLRITSMKTIKPPDPELLKQQEEIKLRAQLQKEIACRSRSCAHKGYECYLPVVTGRQYCARHILQDHSAPYKQCSHTYGNGEKCRQPAPAEQRDHRDSGLCFEHARAALYARQRSTAPPPPVQTTETLLNQLQHYVKPERTRTTSCASSVSVVSDPSEQEPNITLAVDPFRQIDSRQVNASYSASIMECGSASESDCDSVSVGAEISDPQDCDESPCEMQPLWRAGVYTAEEAVSEAKNALKSLQSVYIRQLGRLRTLLQMGRTDYLKTLKTEKEQYCSINAQSRSGPLSVRERRQLRKLKAYASYHRRHGVDAVLARKLYRKRAKVNDTSNRHIPTQTRCTFSEYNVRCQNQSLPAAKHCMKHVLHDNMQVLFVPCCDPRGGTPCREPVARLPVPSAHCRYHTNPPQYTVFTLKKDNSDSDSNSHSTSDTHTDEADIMLFDNLTEVPSDSIQYD